MSSRLETKLLGEMARASAEHRLVEPGDRILVGVSGGKDSHALLYLLREIRKRAPFSFSLIAVNVDQGHPGFPKAVLPEYFEREGYEYRIVEEDTYSVVVSKIPEGKTYCSLCSRLRRGILYTVAKELCATKIALGHHRDDAIETLLLNLFYSGQTKAMPPRLEADDGRNVVIRPLLYSAEADIAALSREKGFPIIPCDLCGSQENLKRKRMKRLVDELSAENPNVRGSLFAALSNVRPTHLMDTELSRALGLAAPGDGKAPLPADAAEAPDPADAPENQPREKPPRRLPIAPGQIVPPKQPAEPPPPPPPRKLPILVTS